jgi:hypothetical protein
MRGLREFLLFDFKKTPLAYPFPPASETPDRIIHHMDRRSVSLAILLLKFGTVGPVLTQSHQIFPEGSLKRTGDTVCGHPV